MTGAVTLPRSIVLRTRGTASSTAACMLPGSPPCAVLQAAPDLDAAGGFLQILDGSTDVTVEHLVLDGNRGARLGSAAASACAAGNNRKGFNAIARGTGHRFAWNASVRALCGTGMEWRGGEATISWNYFGDNGDHETNRMWADGLTVHEADSSTIEGNECWNNSDVNLIVGGGAGSTIRGNRIVNTTQASFAGLMLDNFNGGTSGDFRGTAVTGNRVDCTTLLCDFAVEIGPHAWYLPRNIFGGEVHGNTAVHGKFCINVEGAGTAESPVAVWDNAIGGSPASASFMCGTRPTSNYNIGPDSVVDHRGDATAWTAYTHHECP
jgi:hypothetical protein